jgi:uncharacterized membrane protein YphA (DoxX/SURF4 family)
MVGGFNRWIQGTAGLVFSRWPSRIIRWGLALVFLYAGTVKLLDPKAFARSISQYDLAPDFLLLVLAVGLPLLEILGAVGVIFSVRGSLSLIFGLLLFFVTVLWYGILKDLHIDCGCFSPEELQAQAGLWRAFYRDLTLISAAIYLYLSRWVRKEFNPNLPFWAKIKLTL